MASEQVRRRKPITLPILWRWLRGMSSGSWWRSYAMVLQPLEQLEPASQPGSWKASGNDPKFECVSAGFPLKAGWYRLSVALEDLEGDRLSPMLYVDYGYGMHETWALNLGFFRSAARRHVGVVLLLFDVQRLRFDPASVPCEFRASDLRFRRLSRVGAAWRMLHAVATDRNVRCPGVCALVRDAWRKVRGPGGVHAFATWLHERYMAKGNVKAPTYKRWLELYDLSVEPVRTLPVRLVSILLPTFNTPEIWLRHCLDSVLAQSYPHWELCVADDASTEPQVRKVLEAYAKHDSRIRITWRERNGHISVASNSALAMARGDCVALLDHDDELHPCALALIVEAWHRHPQWQFVYTDEDKIDADGQRYEPYFKPNWNQDLLHGQNCVSHLGVYSRTLLNAVGGFREGLEGSQDWDLVLRCSERLTPGQIGHVPAVLYHWRAIAGSTAQGVGEKLCA